MIRIYHHREVSPQYTTELHTHGQHELYFLLGGQRRYFIRHSIYDLSPGNLILIPKGALHKTVSKNSQGYDRFVLFFNDEDVRSLSDMLGENAYAQLLEMGCVQLPADAVQKITQQLKQMQQEFSAQPNLYSLYLEAQLQLILLTVLRCGTQQPKCAENTAEKIQKVAQYIGQNFRLPITLHDAAQMACLEDTYFSKQFKALTGFGFLDYLTQIRLQEAQRLLRTTSLSLSDISEMCGYSGSNYFGDVFRRYAGISPSAYRKQS